MCILALDDVEIVIIIVIMISIIESGVFIEN